MQRCAGNARERFGQRPATGPDFDERLARARTERGDDLVDDLRVFEEMLAKALSRSQLSILFAASLSASSIAAMKLPESALPEPAMSSAVP